MIRVKRRLDEPCGILGVVAKTGYLDTLCGIGAEDQRRCNKRQRLHPKTFLFRRTDHTEAKVVSGSGKRMALPLDTYANVVLRIILDRR